MLRKYFITTALTAFYLFIATLIVFCAPFKTAFALSNEQTLIYQISLDGKNVGAQTVEIEALPNGKHKYVEKTSLKLKKFFMTFNIQSEYELLFDDNGVKEFSGFDTFNDEKMVASGKRFGSKFEVSYKEDDEPEKRFVVDTRQYEFSDATPPIMLFQMFEQKQVGDEVAYLDLESGSIQGIKITALKKQRDVITASYHYIGDKEFTNNNDEQIQVTLNKEGHLLRLQEDDFLVELVK